MTEFSPLEVCTDCYFDHHYGVVENDSRTADEVARFRSLKGPLFDWTNSETGEGITEFSKWKCEGCGSTFHGKRFKLADGSEVAGLNEGTPMTGERAELHKAWLAAFTAHSEAFDAFYPNLDDPEYVKLADAADAAGDALDNYRESV